MSIFGSIFNFLVAKPITYLATHLQGTQAGDATAAAVIPVAQAAVNALVAKYVPAAIVAVSSVITSAENAISATTPQTLENLLTQLHASVANIGWAVDVVQVVQNAMTVAVATGAGQLGVSYAEDLSKAQLEKIKAAIIAQINAASGAAPVVAS